MEKNKRKFNEIKEKGITLVALVVTIVILLILAGVTINMAVNQNGLFGRAKNAVATYKDSASKEEADLESLMAELDGNGGEQYKDDKGVNVPKLTNGMIPIKYNGTSWVICSSDDSTWYNYTDTNNNGTVETSEMQWANIMLSDGKYTTSSSVGTAVADSDLGSMFVWIPRYAYSISKYKTSANGEGTTQKITDVTFLKGATNLDAEGNSYSTDYDADNVVEGQATPKIVHSGFKFGDTNVTGLWVAKFEASMVETNNNVASSTENNTTSKTVKVTPNTETWRYIQVGNCFANCLNMKADGNKYGINASSTNSHLMKNSEWGAVAYLCASQYGITPTLDNSCLSYTENSITKYHSYSGGYKGEGTNGYKENVTQSTTGNVTGIYDLNGGAWEYVAAYYDNSDPGVGGQGTSAFFTNNVLKSEYSNYWDTYKVGNDEKTIYGPSRSKL